MIYAEFKTKNDKIKLNVQNKGSILRIEKVSFEKEMVLLSNKFTIKIESLVQSVMQGKCCISNPSVLKNWKGFQSSKIINERYIVDIEEQTIYDKKEKETYDFIDIESMYEEAFEESWGESVTQANLTYTVNCVIQHIKDGCMVDLWELIYEMVN